MSRPMNKNYSIAGLRPSYIWVIINCLTQTVSTMKFSKYPFIFIVLFYSTLLQAQSIGIGTNVPDASAVLDVSSTTHGFLPPRMYEYQRNAINEPKNLEESN